MRLLQEAPVYKACYDLLLEIFRFTKEYKYTVGESLIRETIELITLIYRADSRLASPERRKTARFANKWYSKLAGYWFAKDLYIYTK
jgi:hypothetical protein